MARSRSSYLNELSTADLKQLLEARQRIDVLEKEKARLTREMAAVDSELERLVAGVEKPAAAGARTAPPNKTVRKKAAKKATRKTTKKVLTRKKAAKKTAATKKAATRKAATKKAATRKAATKKIPAGKKVTAKQAPARKKGPAKAAQPKLEDIVLGIIKARGGPVAYQDLLKTIVSGKLFKSKSKNFDNVLRRTLSTSKLVKQAGRGIYEAA